jgi:hypothetical protein
MDQLKSYAMSALFGKSETKNLAGLSKNQLKTAVLAQLNNKIRIWKNWINERPLN